MKTNKNLLSYLIKTKIYKNLLFILIYLFSISCGFHFVVSQPILDKVEICNNKNCSQKITGNDPIYIKLKFKKAPYGTRVKTIWYYIDKKTKKLLRERVSDIDHPIELYHGIKAPRSGHWKAGNYSVVVMLNNKIVKTLGFTVQKTPEPKKSPKITEPQNKEKDMLDDDF